MTVSISDHGLLVLSVWIGALTLLVAVGGVALTYLSVRYVAEQLTIMKEEQRARTESEGTLLSTSEGTVLVGGALGRFLKGASQRLYGR